MLKNEHFNIYKVLISTVAHLSNTNLLVSVFVG
jgi:hypothetical protein